MYKDKDKQRGANRIAQAKFKAKGITEMGIIGRVLPARRGKDIKCFEDLPPDVQQSIRREPEDQWPRRTAAAIYYQHQFPDRYYPNSGVSFGCLMAAANPKTIIRGSKPGDPDYDGVCLDEKYKDKWTA